MKVALVTDLHFGVRSDSQIFLDYFREFFEQQFFPTVRARKIETIFVLGDVVDRRKYININTANFMRKHFIEPLADYSSYVLAGNHDVYHTNTLAINALDELARGHTFLRPILEPKELFLTDGTNILALPWICAENEAKSMEMIRDTKAKICFGHLQLQGFEMHAGHICDSGLDAVNFSKFDLVASGHFHHKSSRDNIHYLGAACQMTWADYNDSRGFHIFDTETLELEYIPNKREMFLKLVYNDKDKTLDEVMDWDFEKLKNTYIKVIPQTKTNPYWFDMFIDALEKHAADVKVVEDTIDISDVEEDLMEECENTVSILKKFIEQTKLQGNKKNLEHFLVSLYNEALTLET